MLSLPLIKSTVIVREGVLLFRIAPKDQDNYGVTSSKTKENDFCS